jgi:hypothetical protein
VDEDQVAQRLHSRPLVVHALVLDAGRVPHARHGRRPVGAQLPPSSAQVVQVFRADEPADRVTTVELGLDVLHDFDAVHDEVAHQSVDHGVLHDHADQTGVVQVALAELRTLHVLVHVPLHARQAMPDIRNDLPRGSCATMMSRPTMAHRRLWIG